MAEPIKVESEASWKARALAAEAAYAQLVRSLELLVTGAIQPDDPFRG